MYLSEMEPVLRPADAFAHLARGGTERVPIDELEGRVTTSLLTPYPPGIPLLIPGERFNEIIVNYLKFARDFNSQFPGFEADIHGLIIDVQENGSKEYYVDCLSTANI
jgi:arginine/lysine/ornithine decarboxylase